jgi:hypothetical protein
MVILMSAFLLPYRYSVLRYGNKDAKTAMALSLLFSAQLPTKDPQCRNCRRHFRIFPDTIA